MWAIIGILFIAGYILHYLASAIKVFIFQLELILFLSFELIANVFSLFTLRTPISTVAPQLLGGFSIHDVPFSRSATGRIPSSPMPI